MDWIQAIRTAQSSSLLSRRRVCPRLGYLATVLAISAVTTAAFSQDAKTSDLDFAHGLYGRKEYGLAAEEYQNFLRRAPTGALAEDARFFLAESLFQLKRPVEALENYALLIADDNEQKQHFRMALLRYGELQFERGEHAKAIDSLRKFTVKFRRDPLSARAYYFLGAAELAENKLSEAEAAFAEAAKSTNSQISSKAKLGRAKALAKQGDAAKATELINELMQSNSSAENDRLLLTLGTILLDAGKPDSALDAFDRLLRQHSQSKLTASARLGRGQALDRQGRHADAQTEFRSLLEESAWPPGDESRADAWLWFGLSQSKQGKPEQAAITFRQAMRLFPRSARAEEFAFHAAVAELENGKANLARPQFESIAASSSTSGLAKTARVYLARCLLELKDYPAVYRLYEDFASSNPDKKLLDQMTMMAGQAALDDAGLNPDRKSQLFARLAKAADSDSTRMQLQHLAANAMYRRGDWADTRREIQSILDAKPTSLLRTQCLYLLSLCELKQKRFAEAADAMEEAIDLAFDGVQGAEASGDKLPMELVKGFVVAGGQIAAGLEPGVKSRRLLDKLSREAARRNERAELLLDLANGLHAGRRFAEARRLYDRVLTLDAPANDKGKILNAVAWAEFENGEFVRAAERFKAAAESTSAKSPQHVDATYMHAVATERTLGESTATDSSAAMTLARLAETYLAVFRNPIDSSRRMEAGLRAVRTLGKLKRFDDAEKLLRELADIGGSQGDIAAQVAYEKAWLQVDRGNPADGFREFKQIAMQFPNSTFAGEAALKAAEIAFDLKQFSESMQLAQSAEAVLTDRTLKSSAVLRRGLAAFELRRWDVAVAAFEKLKLEASAKQAAAAAYWLAEIDFLREQTEAALARFQAIANQSEATDLKPTAKLRTAQCELALKHYDRALERANEFAVEHPNSPLATEAAIVQGRVLIRQAKFDDARAKLESAVIDKSEASARAQFLIGQTFAHQQRYDEAIKAFLRVEILFTYAHWQSLALLEAGKCYEHKKETAAAKALYDRLIDKFPDSEPATAARKLRAAATNP